MNIAVVIFLIVAVIFAIVTTIAINNDKEIEEWNIIKNSEILSEEEKLIFLSIIKAKNDINSIKKIAVIILLIIIIPIIIRIIIVIASGETFLNIIDKLY